ncbi:MULTISPECIES: class I SAM-dependent methyltransferase [unclassified Rathayibacter]|uniref:class I SAM-dependent methyltransferase n=1 Tax=unclassified Rathayibacter TaxID=2609250 RepID=UPI00188C2542|nr:MULTISPECIES: class I SAM-dependent methyltransferase [unclassified Rathayibacter]MBF4461155.1 class I SAM-dependent methyltransferase [Rathayibacter sp. VKM Ac-2879]MBF4502566.1 class I SAM-dependent methyltransferase [Rathayibacter sp. VKM Ac-2878]
MTTAREHWEARYSDSGRVWSGRPNATLVDLVGGLTPGRALDLGAGEGGDVLWLASRGWRVTGLDLSETALTRAREAAARQGLDVALRYADLAGDWPVAGDFDLVTASFLHSMVELPRIDILRRAAELVAPGGHLAIVSHVAPPPGAREHHHGASEAPLELASPEEELAALALDARWIPLVVETRERVASGPDGHEVPLLDGVLLVRRSATD